jgi:hypothetical protein|tara:strand:+ start:36 stop:308 length:273 start_codon:yes stop_codon:yes gene_type:complete
VPSTGTKLQDSSFAFTERTNMKNVVNISVANDIKQRKLKELVYYQSELQKLHTKLIALQHEITVTESIIEMIENEKVLEIKLFTQGDTNE